MEAPPSARKWAESRLGPLERALPSQRPVPSHYHRRKPIDMPESAPQVTIRAIESRDEAAWRGLWQLYNEF